MTTTNCHVICKRGNIKCSSFVWRHTYFVLHISWRNKRCRCQYKIGMKGSKNQSIFRLCSWHKTLLALKTMQWWTLPKVENLYCRNEFTDHGMGGQAIQLLQPVLCQQNQSSNMLHTLIVIAMRNNGLTFIHIFTYHICMSRLYELILILTRFYLQSEIFWTHHESCILIKKVAKSF